MRKALTDTGYRYFLTNKTEGTVESEVFTSLVVAAAFQADLYSQLEGTRSDLQAIIDKICRDTEIQTVDFVLTREEFSFVADAIVHLESGEELDEETQYRLGRVVRLVELIFAFSQQDNLYDLETLAEMFSGLGLPVEGLRDNPSDELDTLHDKVYGFGYTLGSMRNEGLLAPSVEAQIREHPRLPSTPAERTLVGQMLRTQLQLVKTCAPKVWRDIFKELNLTPALT